MAKQPGTLIPNRAVLNLRDLGGWPIADGRRVRYGMVYRSTWFQPMTADDRAGFERLGVRSVFDLRTEAERAKEPDDVPPGVQHIVLDVLANSQNAVPTQLMHVIEDPTTQQAILGEGRGEQWFIQAYREIISLPSAQSCYGALFTDLASGDHRPAVFHCTTGKDRAGWAAAALLLLLGVSREHVMQDFMLTNTYLLPALQPVIDSFRAAGGDPVLLLPVLGVKQQYLEAAFDEMVLRFDTIEGYFAKALGIDARAQQHLRNVFIDQGWG